jgi:uncharacterized protein (DUF433 family)
VAGCLSLVAGKALKLALLFQGENGILVLNDTRQSQPSQEISMKAIRTLKLPQRKPRVARHPEILGGKPVIAGTRIPVRLILDHLAEGYMPEEIIVEYPELSRADIRAALRFASRAIEKIENADMETISLSTNPKFLAIIERSQARQEAEGGISSDEMRRRLGLKRASRRKITKHLPQSAC